MTLPKTRYSNKAYLEAYTQFLQCIGQDGREFLAALLLKDTRERILGYHYDFTKFHSKKITVFFRLLHQCTNLETLDVHNILPFAPVKVTFCINRARPQPRSAVRLLANRFTSFPKLKHLHMRYTPIDCCAVWFYRFYGGGMLESDQETRYREVMMRLKTLLKKGLGDTCLIEVINTQALSADYVGAVGMIDPSQAPGLA